MSVYPNKILYVDLSAGSIQEEEIAQEDIRDYLGSRGLNARLLWNLTDAGTDPLGPENPLIFGAGTLSGTHAPSSGRTTVTTLSPATNIGLKSSTGGHWGAELKFAGYSILVIKGRAERPVYIWIDGEQVEIRDAAHLWGLDTRRATDRIKEELGDDEIQVSVIGQAGENRVKFASIMFNYYNTAARGGTGAVMGSKNLKAVAVRGSRPLTVAQPELFDKLSLRVRGSLSRDMGSMNLSEYGTAGIVDTVNTIHALPSYNFRESYIEEGYLLGGQHLRTAGYLKRRFACGACGTGCHRYTTVDEGPYRGSNSGGPEFETLSALGSGCGITDTKTVLKGNELCNLYGMDTISAGSVIQWAMECYEKGLLSSADTGGIALEWGSSEALIKMLEDIAYRRDFGDFLANGVKNAAERLGGESWKWAVQAKGLEQSRVEIRMRKGYSLAFAVNPRGPDHLHTECVAESARTPEAKALIVKICGSEEYATPYITDKRADIIRWHEDCYAVTDALGFCAFATTLAYAIGPQEMADLFSAGTGISMTEEEIMKAGRRILTLEKCINVRRGLDRSDDSLPWRVMNEPIASGAKVGMRSSHEEIEKMLDDYYRLHGWDPQTSWPTAETLSLLGLDKMAAELKAIGKLPGKN